MKRALHLIAALAVAALTFAGPAHARIVPAVRELTWWNADTTTLKAGNDQLLHPSTLGSHKMFAAAQVCSTVVADMSDAVPPPGYTLTTRGSMAASLASATWADTIPFAKVTIWSDSTTSTLTNAQILVDYVPAGALGPQAGTATVAPAGVQVYRKTYSSMGSKRAYSFPIPVYNNIAVFDTATVAGDPSGTSATLPAAPNLLQTRGWRIRFANITGILPAARVRIEYWVDTDAPERPKGPR